MAGHSKWANIKRRKGAQDAKRAKVFTRILKEIAIAVKEGGNPDPDSNPRLRLAIANAKGVNMPKDNINRAIKKASDKDSENYAEVTYEGYGPAGIALFVEATTDNINRTVSNVRAIFTKYGGSLGTNGSLEFIFDRKGVFTIPVSALEGKDMDEFEMELIDGGAEDVEKDEEFVTIYTSFEDFGNMQKKLEELGIEAESQELQRIPKTTSEVEFEDGKKVLNIIEKFEEDDDVNNVYHNMEMTDELAEAMEE
ncbi:MAG: YebC/PmpR family DNA-binding transcriptional regulator [Flavobacteriales bacterium]|nr:YebC/PmpR family DNA-binding transcriptional regulator [Flavobacteriales bacterium]|tara:strand:+ start:1406 stop:2164 length:759 start_codon:yes stop_codon:yes gene_type:complete